MSKAFATKEAAAASIDSDLFEMFSVTFVSAAYAPAMGLIGEGFYVWSNVSKRFV